MELIKEKITKKDSGFLYFVKRNSEDPAWLDLYKTKMSKGRKKKGG